MANPGAPGTFESWVTTRVPIVAVSPKSGSTGALETWITNRVPSAVYVVAAAAAGGMPFFMQEENLMIGGVTAKSGNFQ